jgi:hypothetical protein
MLAALLGINLPAIHPKAGNVSLTAAPVAATEVSADNAQRKGEKSPFLPADCPEVRQGHVQTHCDPFSSLARLLSAFP